MNESRRKRRDFLQNIIIVMLSISMVLLFAQAQIYNLGVSYDSVWRFLTPSVTPSQSPAATQSPRMTAPVQVAVTGSYGHFGSVNLTTGDDSFAPLRSLLGQALGSAHTYTPCEQTALLQALQKSASVYCDFRTPLPLSVLGELLWASCDNETLLAQRLIVAAEDSSVVLYLWNDDETCLRSETALSISDFMDTVSQYEAGNAQFAFALPEADALSPFSLVPKETPALPVLARSANQPEATQLLAALGFNPNTQNHYVDTNGTTVIREGERTLRIQTDGVVSYQSGEDDSFSIGDGNVPFSLVEAVTSSMTLLNALTDPFRGDAALFVTGVQEEAGSITLTFEYQVKGVPIHSADGHSAAELTLSGTAVTAVTLRLCQYTVTEDSSLLLPLPQALAIAALQENKELSIGYADSGQAEVSAQWLLF